MDGGAARAVGGWLSARERPAPLSETQVRFLRSCLNPGPERATAFATWSTTVGDRLSGLRDPASADRHLMALLYDALTTAGVDAPAEFLSVLRASTVHEEIRWDAVAAAGAEVLGVLKEARIEPLVVGGTALAFGSYRSPALRHCHNIDLLVAPSLLERSRQALGRDFDCHQEDGRLLVDHPSGTRLAVGVRLHRASFGLAPDTFGRPIRAVEVGGRSVRTLEPADLLAQVCTNAASVLFPGLRWVADAALLVEDPGLDWERLRDHARLARCAVPVLRTLAALRSLRGARNPTGSRPRAATGRRRRTGRQTRARGAASGRLGIWSAAPLITQQAAARSTP